MPPEADQQPPHDAPAPEPQVASDATSAPAPTLDPPHRRALDAFTKLCENLPGKAEAKCEAVSPPAGADPAPTLDRRDVAVTVTAGSVTGLNDALVTLHRRARGEFPQSVGSAVAVHAGDAADEAGKWSRRDVFGVAVRPAN